MEVDETVQMEGVEEVGGQDRAKEEERARVPGKEGFTVGELENERAMCGSGGMVWGRGDDEEDGGGIVKG